MLIRNHHMLSGAAILILATISFTVQPAAAQVEEHLPPAVSQALESRFPGADVMHWTKEIEDDIPVFDIEFALDGAKHEADIDADGRIRNWERAIGMDDLPAAAIQAVEAKYPGFVPSEIMAVTAVTGEGDELEGYEILLDTADGEQIEVTVSPDGEILENSGDTE